MTRERRSTGALTVLVALVALAGCTDEGAARPGRPSIVLVSIDTLGARHTSLHGYARPTTPTLERLAQSSVVFDRAWANAPWTTPSYMSQFTGLLAAAFEPPAGTTGDDGAPWVFSADHVTLAEALAAAGYRTAAFVDNWNVGPQLGFDQGFERYDVSAAEIGLEDPTGGIRHVAPLALEWLDGLTGDAPFFLFVQVLDVHGPYHAGHAWRADGRFPADPPCEDPGGPVPIATGDDHALGAIPRHIAEPFVPPGAEEAEVCPFVDDYDAGVRATDEALGGFLDALEARGVLDRAVLVVSADHGESLTEHDNYFDHRLLHGEELHVPLVVREPGGGAARRVSTDVQLVDLYPTLLELAGAEGPPGHGRSLVPALRGTSLPATPCAAHGTFLGSRGLLEGRWKLIETRPSIENSGLAGFLSTPFARAWLHEHYPETGNLVFGTSRLPVERVQELSADDLAAATKALSGPFRHLYDVEEDPGETRDLAAEQPERVQAMLARLEALDAHAREAWKAGEARPVDPGIQAELEKLGYGGR